MKKSIEEYSKMCNEIKLKILKDAENEDFSSTEFLDEVLDDLKRFEYIRKEKIENNVAFDCESDDKCVFNFDIEKFEKKAEDILINYETEEDNGNTEIENRKLLAMDIASVIKDDIEGLKKLFL